MTVVRVLVLTTWLLVGTGSHAVPATLGGPSPEIDATGSADVTADLQELIDGTPDGGVVRLRRDGEYRVEGTLLVLDRHDLEIDGNRARIFSTTTDEEHRGHLRIVGGSRLHVHDLEITGSNPHAGLDDRAYQPHLVGHHGIRLEGARDVELARLRISDTYGDFVYVGRSEGAAWSDGVWIHTSRFERSGRQGITVTAGRNVVVERNLISHTRRATIDLEPNGPTWGAVNVHILDNAVGPGRLLFVAAAGRGPVEGVVVARNRLRGHILNVIVEPPPGDRRVGFWVVDNSSDTPATRSPMRFTRVDGLIVTGNTQAVTRAGAAAVATLDACGVHVAGNEVAPGAVQVTGAEGGCPAAGVPDPMPSAPLVAGRTAEGAGTTTTAAPAATATVPTAAAPLSHTEDDARVWLIAGGGAVAMLAVATWGVVVSARRTVRRDGRRRPPQSRTR